LTKATLQAEAAARLRAATASRPDFSRIRLWPDYLLAKPRRGCHDSASRAAGIFCNRLRAVAVLAARRAGSWPCFHWRGHEHALPVS